MKDTFAAVWFLTRLGAFGLSIPVIFTVALCLQLVAGSTKADDWCDDAEDFFGVEPR